MELRRPDAAHQPGQAGEHRDLDELPADHALPFPSHLPIRTPVRQYGKDDHSNRLRSAFDRQQGVARSSYRVKKQEGPPAGGNGRNPANPPVTSGNESGISFWHRNLLHGADVS
ncbi:hypothetical protein GCM10012275_48690 [Longimycelium tulufanense]|uniref:Uncharacterized protein n=1 Tax=Longimycelium tulufanense TaxID=907463 RepID=A0A8J3CJL3_9PSEU|nr:hypothetical protein GCM10012275_48690 [Longimycelium tulufanense]